MSIRNYLLWAIGVGAVLALGVLAVAGSLPHQAAAAPNRDPLWISLTGDRPLVGHDAVYDPATREMVLHGGEQQLEPGRPPLDTRQLDLATTVGDWSSLATTGDAPVARLDSRGMLGSAAVLDPDERVMLVVCDCRDGSTYLLDLRTNTWSKALGDQALALWFPVMVYDAPRDRAVLYGGLLRGLDIASTEGWAYDLSPERRGWTPLPVTPFKQIYAAGDYEPRSQHLVIFGGLEEGADGQGNLARSLWRLDLAHLDGPDAWRDITDLVGPGPSPRTGATLTFDPETGMGVLYGGSALDQDPGGAWISLEDAWILDYSQPESPEWYHLVFDESGGGGRSGHSAVWDSAHRYVIYYGGQRQEGQQTEVLSDTWALDPGLGDRPMPTTPPVPTTPPPTATEPSTGPSHIFIPYSVKLQRRP